MNYYLLWLCAISQSKKRNWMQYSLNAVFIEYSIHFFKIFISASLYMYKHGGGGGGGGDENILYWTVFLEMEYHLLLYRSLLFMNSTSSKGIVFPQPRKTKVF